MTYEQLLLEAEREDIKVYEHKLPVQGLKGLYFDNIIILNSSIVTTTAEKTCILAEELGHYHTSHGDILNQRDIKNRKQEQRARSWAYEKIIPLDKLIEAYKSGIRNRYELAEFLGVTEDFVEGAIDYYKKKCGLYVEYNDFVICFEPICIMRKLKFRQLKNRQLKKIKLLPCEGE